MSNELQRIDSPEDESHSPAKVEQSGPSLAVVRLREAGIQAVDTDNADDLMRKIRESSAGMLVKSDLRKVVARAFQVEYDEGVKRVEVVESGKTEIVENQVGAALKLARSNLERLVMEVNNSTRDEVVDLYITRIQTLSGKIEALENQLEESGSTAKKRGLEISVQMIEKEIGKVQEEYDAYIA